MDLKEFNMGLPLAVISVLGFFAIFVQSITGFSISEWVNAFLFIIIGITLAILGGIKLIFRMLSDGVQSDEIPRIVTILIAIASVVVGILTLPVISVQAPFISGIKMIISLFAMIIIIADAMVSN